MWLRASGIVWSEDRKARLRDCNLPLLCLPWIILMSEDRKARLRDCNYSANATVVVAIRRQKTEKPDYGIATTKVQVLQGPSFRSEDRKARLRDCNGLFFLVAGHRSKSEDRKARLRDCNFKLLSRDI